MNTPGFTRAAFGFSLMPYTSWGVITGMNQQIISGVNEHEKTI